jgi:hypothetical protein
MSRDNVVNKSPILKYKVGDRFEVVESGFWSYKVGEIVKLYGISNYGAYLFINDQDHDHKHGLVNLSMVEQKAKLIVDKEVKQEDNVGVSGEVIELGDMVTHKEGSSFGWSEDGYKVVAISGDSISLDDTYGGAVNYPRNLLKIVKKKALQEKETSVKCNPEDAVLTIFGKVCIPMNEKDLVFTTIKPQNDLKQQEESNMANRKVVSVKLLDNDSGLDVADSLVYDFGNIVTEDDQATTITQLAVDYNIAEIIDQHNLVRSGIVDKDILKRTGLEVFLQPIKLKNLTWSYTQV